MATKKEIAKEKAIKGGMPSDVADNIFTMQMGDKEVDTPTTFSTKNQKVMAMSTMFQTPDPDGETVTSIRQDEFEVPRYMGSPEFQSTFAEADKAGLDVFEFPKGSGKMFTTEKGPATETHYLESVDTDTLKAASNQPAFDRSFDSVFKPDLPGANLEKFTYKKKGDSKPGMVDTFTSYDTRQARRKGIVEGRGVQQAARDVKQNQRKTDRLGRKEEKQLFKDRKKQAQQEKRQARKDLNQAKRQNRQDKRSTRDAFSASPNISGSAGFGLKSGMVSSDRSVTDARARLDAAKSNLKSTRKDKPLTAAEQRRSRKKTFQDTKTAQSQKQLQKARDIEAQGELQRKAMKNPRTTKEFAMPMLVNKKMSFRK
jgi:hypothetical protein